MARLFYNVYFYIFDDLVHAVTHDALACFKARIYELPPAVHATEGYVPAFRDVVVVEYKHIGGIFVIHECGAWYDHFFNPLFVSKINRNCIVWQQPRLLIFKFCKNLDSVSGFNRLVVDKLDGAHLVEKRIIRHFYPYGAVFFQALDVREII